VSWQIDIARAARKELAVLPPQMQVRIAKAILELENIPFPHGSKKLKNRDGFRIRVGDYRVLYSAYSESKTILVGVIRHRREVYRD
jgi:mRNA interferase RelE/StbE